MRLEDSEGQTWGSQAGGERKETIKNDITFHTYAFTMLLIGKVPQSKEKCHWVPAENSNRAIHIRMAQGDHEPEQQPTAANYVDYWERQEDQDMATLCR